MKKLFLTVATIFTIGTFGWWRYVYRPQRLPFQTLQSPQAEQRVRAPITIHELSIKKRFEDYTLHIQAQTSALFRSSNQITGTHITCILENTSTTRAIVQADKYTLDHHAKSIDFYDGVTTELFIK
jgi:hypothetical protein